LLEILSTSFFGPRYRAVYAGPESVSPPAERQVEAPLALRLVEADAPYLLEGFVRAIGAVRHVEHPAVLHPLQMVRAGTRLGIVTRHVEGVTLAQLLNDASSRDEPIPPAIAMRILSDVLDGLQALRHPGRGLLQLESSYGGVTPDSIHVGLDGQTRYLDAGIASAAARQPRWSHEAAALAYTAPEQTGADPKFDAISDNFSLGVVLWELLTLRPLFGANTPAETLQRVHQAAIPRVQRQQFVRGEPIAFSLAQVVAQALRRDPSQRFATYEEFAIALNAAGTAASRSGVGELARRSLPGSGQDQAVDAGSGSRVRVSVPSPARESARPIAADDQSAEAGADLDFEPPTARIPELPRDDCWPASAAWVPPDVPESTEKITAFPIGDLLRVPQSGRRSVWSVGAACVAVLGLVLLFWKTTGNAPPPRAAAGRPPAAVATDALERTPRASQAQGQAAGAASLPTHAPAIAPPGVASDRPGAKPGSEVTPPAPPNRAASTTPSTAPAPAATRFHRLPKPPRVNGAAAGGTQVQSAPFIPDDI
jgi:serine/threonine-protein kinase